MSSESVSRVFTSRVHHSAISCARVVPPHKLQAIGLVTAGLNGIATYLCLVPNTNMELENQESDLELQNEYKICLKMEIGRDDLPLTCVCSASKDDICLCAFGGLGKSVHVVIRGPGQILFFPLIDFPTKKPVCDLILVMESSAKKDQWKIILYVTGQDILIHEYCFLLSKENLKFKAEPYSDITFNSTLIVGHKRDIRKISMSDNRKILVSGSDDGTICVWNVEKRDLEHNLSAHHNQVIFVEIKNETIFSGGKDHTLSIWALKHTTSKKQKNKNKYKIIHQIQNNCNFNALLTPNDKLIIIGGMDGVLQIYELSKDTNDTWVSICNQKIHESSVNSLALTKINEEDYLFSATSSGDVYLFKLQKSIL